MHFFKLKVVPMQFGTEQKEITYKDFITTCVNQIPKEGMGVVEMKKRIRITDAMESVDDDNKIGLEDADWIVLKQCVNSMSWAMVSKDIVEFVDYIEVGGETE